MKVNNRDICPLCGGGKKKGTIIFSADLGYGVVVVRKVPATICSQCGTDWIADNIAARIEELVEDAKKRHHQVEVTAFS